MAYCSNIFIGLICGGKTALEFFWGSYVEDHYSHGGNHEVTSSWYDPSDNEAVTNNGDNESDDSSNNQESDGSSDKRNLPVGSGGNNSDQEDGMQEDDVESLLSDIYSDDNDVAMT